MAGHQLRTVASAMNEWTDSIMMPLPLFHTYGNTGASLALINHNPISPIPNGRDIPALLKEITNPAGVHLRCRRCCTAS